DDKEAVKWYRLAAEQGITNAQTNLALMYDNGEGVIEDDKEAVKWYRLAAEQGNAKAQSNLAFMHATGEGVIEDNVYAHMWWNLAAASGSESARSNKEILIKKMTPQGISKAQDLARECVKKNYKDC
ncbi:sel1 repeat family protein, partial [Pseudomonadales bacterium]|nr:sel1 repeat family protein [Pseudomonadales bacterium]